MVNSIRATVLVALVTLLGYFTSRAQSNLFLLISEAGDYVGRGGTYVTTNESEFAISGGPDTITISALGFTIYLDAPGASNLTITNYTNAVRWPFNGALPGISISGNGGGCNTVTGEFELIEFQIRTNGQMERFWARFSQGCESSAPTMVGEVRYHSVLAPPLPQARTIRVPADYPTIQAAVDAASVLTSDTILIAPGIYTESVRLKGKPIQLLTERGPAQTILKAPFFDSTALLCDGNEPSATLVSGLTIADSAGGVYFHSSFASFVSNVIVNCGYGIECRVASPTLRGNRISDCKRYGVYLGSADRAVIEHNIIERNADGITIFSADTPLIRNNIIRRNRGDGINIVNPSNADIIQNLILDNGASGIWLQIAPSRRGPWLLHNTIIGTNRGIVADGSDSNGRIINNIVGGNPALVVTDFYGTHVPITEHNNFFSTNGVPFGGIVSNLTGMAGNISAPPIFLQPHLNDYRLRTSSPGIDAATTNESTSTDFEGNPRPVEGNQSPPSLPDMGAYEYVPGPPRPATVVTATATLTNVSVTWWIFDDATNYLVRRATNAGGPYIIVAESNGTNFIDANVTADVVYYYVIAGQSGFGIGMNSTEISIKAGNHPPNAVDDFVQTDEDVSILIRPLANDSDPDGDPLLFRLLSPPPNGRIVISNETIVFTPPGNASGTNTFSYEVADGRGGSAIARIIVAVRPVNDRPTCVGAGYTFPANGILTNNLTASDVDSSNLEFILIAPPGRGVASLDRPTGRIIYRPAHGFVGTDSLRFVVSDGQTNSAEATVTLRTIAPADIDRDGIADTWEARWEVDSPDSDPDRDGLTTLEEYLANTNPRDASSGLRLIGVTVTTNGESHITWSSTGGTRYRVWSVDSLTPQSALTPITRSADQEMDALPYGVPGVQTIFDQRPLPITGQRFYRISVVQ